MLSYQIVFGEIITVALTLIRKVNGNYNTIREVIILFTVKTLLIYAIKFFFNFGEICNNQQILLMIKFPYVGR